MFDWQLERIDADEKLVFYSDHAKRAPAIDVIQQSLEQRGHSLTGEYDEFLIDVYLMLDKAKSSHIAIDWDNTISADQEYFRYLIRNFQAAGYTPFVCTLRAPDRENILEICNILDEAEIPIYFTDGKPKRKFMKNLGVKVHLWIDDFYPAICGDACKLLSRNHIK